MQRFFSSFANWRAISIGVVASFLVTACGQSEAPTAQKELLIYCGITMIKPMKHLAEAFEKEHNVKITLTQGGSQDLYDSLKLSQEGDLYLPGSSSYRDKYLSEGLLGEKVLLGYNRIALVVPEGNPQHLTADLAQLTNKKLAVVLCNPHSGSIGKATEKLLNNVGLKEAAYNNATYLTTDSRRINEAFKKGEADISLNWYATAIWPDNASVVDVIELPAALAKPKALELSLLNFSKDKALAKSFMDYAASDEGRRVFKQFGFLTDREFEQLVPAEPVQ